MYGFVPGNRNMELPVGRVMDLYRKEVESYANPMIRHIKGAVGI
jgi:sialate O-acetylesterase